MRSTRTIPLVTPSRSTPLRLRRRGLPPATRCGSSLPKAYRLRGCWPRLRACTQSVWPSSVDIGAISRPICPMRRTREFLWCILFPVRLLTAWTMCVRRSTSASASKSRRSRRGGENHDVRNAYRFEEMRRLPCVCGGLQGSAWNASCCDEVACGACVRGNVPSSGEACCAHVVHALRKCTVYRGLCRGGCYVQAR